MAYYGRVKQIRSGGEWKEISGTISPEEFTETMKWYAESEDVESRHGNMDDLMSETLRRAGYSEGCDVFDSVLHWYS